MGAVNPMYKLSQMISSSPTGHAAKLFAPKYPVCHCPPMTGKVLVAMPAWNEAETVADTIAEVQGTGLADEILVVDDGSTDATGDISRSAGARVLTLPFNVGVGGAMRTAFLHAQRSGFDIVLQVDADGQHDPAQIPLLIDALDTSSVGHRESFRWWTEGQCVTCSQARYGRARVDTFPHHLGHAHGHNKRISSLRCCGDCVVR